MSTHESDDFVIECATKKDLLRTLEPFAQGCFSGHVSEWPQLKPTISAAYNEIKETRNSIDRINDYLVDGHTLIASDDFVQLADRNGVVVCYAENLNGLLKEVK